MSSQFGSSTGDTITVDQQPPSPLAPSAPEVLPPQPELPPSPPPEVPPSPPPELPPSPPPELPPSLPPEPTQPLPQITQPQAQPPPQSTQLQAQPWQPAELQHQAAVTGASPGPTLTISAPPAYSEVTKDQPQQPLQYLPQQGAYPVHQGAYPVQQSAYPVQHIQQAGQPQYMFSQQPAVQPGIQTIPYTMQAQLQQVAFPRPNYPGPHDFYIFTMITASILGLLNPTSLVFGIPATLFSGQSKEHKYRGDYPAAKKYANVALGLIITTIIYVLGGAVFAIGMSLGLHYQYFCTRGSFSYC